MQAWLKTRSQQEGDTLRNLFAKIYGDLHSFVQIKLKAKMMIREALYIRQCYDVLQGILDIGEEASKLGVGNYFERRFIHIVL